MNGEATLDTHGVWPHEGAVVVPELLEESLFERLSPSSEVSAVSDYPFDGPNPSEPLQEFDDGDFRFRFLVIPARVSAYFAGSADGDGRFAVQVFALAYESVLERISLRQDPRWKVVLLRRRNDVWRTSAPVAMVEFVDSEEAGLRRVDELEVNWRCGQEFIDVVPITFKQLRQEVSRSKPNLGPIPLPRAAGPGTRRDAGPASRVKPSSSKRTGEISPGARKWTATVLGMVSALITSQAAGPRVYLPFTLAAGVFFYFLFAWLNRSNST